MLQASSTIMIMNLTGKIILFLTTAYSLSSTLEEWLKECYHKLRNTLVSRRITDLHTTNSTQDTCLWNIMITLSRKELVLVKLRCLSQKSRLLQNIIESDHSVKKTEREIPFIFNLLYLNLF